jgi:hypothetical protein
VSPPWQVVPDQNEDADHPSSPSADLRRVVGLAVVVLVLAASAASTLDRSSPAPTAAHRPTSPATRVPTATRGPSVPAFALRSGAAAPGTYFLPNPYLDSDPIRSCVRGCSDYQRIIFTLPDGWAFNDGLVYKARGGLHEVAFSVWTVDQVYIDPCHWQESRLTRLDIGLIPPREGGLTNQLGRHASEMTFVKLGGQLAWRIDLSVPADLDLATCDRGEFRSWTEWDVVDGANSHNAPGQIDVVYMVDVDRRALVIDASHMPLASEADLAELEAILASMIIDR